MPDIDDAGAVMSLKSGNLRAAGATIAVMLAFWALGKAHSQDSVDSRVEALMATLTLEQKVAQMIQGEIKHVTPDDMRQYGLGSVLNGGGSFPDQNKYSSVQDWLDLADTYYNASIDTSQGNAGIPVIWGTDAVHGHNNVIGATIFPHNIALGAVGDPELTAAIAEATAKEVRATGICLLYTSDAADE